MRVSVRHDAVAQKIAQLALAVKAVEHELATLDSEVARLESAWSGEARRTYARAQQHWSAALAKLKAALAEATRRLITANSISRATADTAARIWS
ncbi:WXG100 family type VII secretion target [uncultured Microbacterium sp.]|uniref:WXG100 family type VII secretion target n=1 Tax=uncultured Microbacterium sp. TaxID=191216 RepID=UPI0028D63850|nr:WXG100 family type VII secretion target [uncultured Microbacterium sp.]